MAQGGPPRGSRLAALELLRGLAALQVAFVHMLGFWGAFHTVMVGAGMAWVPTIVSGRVAVGVFFLMSGYVLQRSSFVTGHAAFALASRYVRLALPVAAAGLFVHALMAVGWFDFQQVRRSLESPQRLWEEVPSVGASLWNSLVTHFTTLVTPDDEYRIINPASWTLSFEFAGSILILLLSRVRRPARGIFAGALVVALGTAPYPYGELLLFPLAVLFVEWLEGPLGRIRDDRRALWVLRVGLVTGVFVGAVVGLFIVIIASVFILFTTFRSEWPTGRFRSLALAAGRISFSVYLIHFPVYIAIMTAATPVVSRQWLLGLARSAENDPVAAGTLLLVVCGVFLSYGVSVLLCAMAFERIVDRRAVALAKAVQRAQDRFVSRLRGADEPMSPDAAPPR